MTKKIRRHLPLMLMAMISLLAALLGGLMRIGWEMPPSVSKLSVLHGPLMVSGFLGNLIGLERAVAIDRGWTYLAPLLTGAGAIMLIAGISAITGLFLITLGSLGLIFIFFAIFRLQPAFHTVVMGLGALSWFTGNLLWLAGFPVYFVVQWWAGFLILTIAGERLELTRMLKPSRTSRTYFIAGVLVFLSGIISAGISFNTGMRITGIGMTLLALWLLRYDVARRTVLQSGLTRFIALCLLSGYIWLFVSGLMALIYGGVMAGPGYDATLHTLFLGFVFVMIFGHAPIIFPAVLDVDIIYSRRFYIHLLLLHVTLILRIGGDMAGWLPGREWGGMLNSLAILFFFANTIFSVRFRPHLSVTSP